MKIKNPELIKGFETYSPSIRQFKGTIPPRLDAFFRQNQSELHDESPLLKVIYAEDEFGETTPETMEGHLRSYNSDFFSGVDQGTFLPKLMIFWDRQGIETMGITGKDVLEVSVMVEEKWQKLYTQPKRRDY